jgi:hypothetical protein
MRLDRRLNLLLYLNYDWDPKWGGALELWDKDVKARVKAYLPIANRVVVFTTTDTAFHGHPDPLTSPKGRYRKSIALYYYTNGRPEEERSETHTTIFAERGQETEAARPRQAFRSTNRVASPSTLPVSSDRTGGRSTVHPGPRSASLRSRP